MLREEGAALVSEANQMTQQRSSRIAEPPGEAITEPLGEVIA
jgi:hypothetical protein